MWPKPSKIGASEQEEEEQEEVEKETEEEKKEKQFLQQRADTDVSHIWIGLNIDLDLKNWKGSEENPYELMCICWYPEISILLLILLYIFIAYLQRTKSTSIPERRAMLGFVKHLRQCCNSGFLKSSTIDILAR